ncbi:MAG TPA: MFS transporter [Propionibacteriaceae bacterium]|jgi:DHA3 family multidrug efflux protein-like MFS transporter
MPDPSQPAVQTAPDLAVGLRTFHRLVANSLLASVTNSFLWFALTFWVFLETRSTAATAVIGGTYMLLLAASGLVFGSYVDRHRRKSAMMASTLLSLSAYAAAGVVYMLASDQALRDLGDLAFWAFVVLLLSGAIAGNLRTVALSTTVTLLVPEERHDKANGLIGTVNGISFALTSVFSGLAIGLLGMGYALIIAAAMTMLAAGHLITIRVIEQLPTASKEPTPLVDIKGAVSAVGQVPGLWALLIFTTFNNLLGGVFMGLMDPYGLTLVSVEIWGMVLAIMSAGFIVGGILVARRGLGAQPVRALLLANVAMWTICALFPIRSSIVLLTIGFMIYTVLIPVVEAAEQTVLQKVVPFREQGRVFGFAQSLETVASPISTFLVGPLAQFVAIPFMTSGVGVRLIGGWFGTGPDRGMGLIFIAAGLIGLAVTLLAFRTRGYRRLSRSYAGGDGPPAESTDRSTSVEPVKPAPEGMV